MIFTCSQPTVSVHFVSLLAHNGLYVRVSDNHPPTIAGQNEIKKAEIFYTEDYLNLSIYLQMLQ